MDGGSADTIGAKRAKLYVYASALGLEREERLGLAEMILRRDISSWSELSAAQVDRMLDALEGAVLVTHLIGQRQESRCR